MPQYDKEILCCFGKAGFVYSNIIPLLYRGKVGTHGQSVDVLTGLEYSFFKYLLSDHVIYRVHAVTNARNIDL